MGFGAGDFMRDLGLNASFMTPEQSELLYTRSRIVICARAAGLQAIDTVFFGLLKDLEGLERETKMALRLGFKGKALIHPSQIEVANRVFSPSEEDIRYASGLVAAFAATLVAGPATAQADPPSPPPTATRPAPVTPGVSQ